MDLFPTQSDVPVRMEWGGDRVESIRQIDIHEQVGVGEVGEVTLFCGQANELPCRSDFQDYLGSGWGTLTCSETGEGERLENCFTRHGLASEPVREAGLAEVRAAEGAAAAGARGLSEPWIWRIRMVNASGMSRVSRFSV